MGVFYLDIFPRAQWAFEGLGRSVQGLAVGSIQLGVQRSSLWHAVIHEAHRYCRKVCRRLSLLLKKKFILGPRVC
jgi:hypothetical protein